MGALTKIKFFDGKFVLMPFQLEGISSRDISVVMLCIAFVSWKRNP